MTRHVAPGFRPAHLHRCHGQLVPLTSLPFGGTEEWKQRLALSLASFPEIKTNEGENTRKNELFCKGPNSFSTANVTFKQRVIHLIVFQKPQPG